MKEDEIQVLGVRKKKRGRFFIVYCLLAFAMLAIVGWFVFLDKTETGDQLEKVKDDTEVSSQAQESCIYYNYYDEGLNDVVLNIYHPCNMEAVLTMDSNELADTLEGKPLLATSAMDIREDNGLPIGEFVMGDQELTSGKRRLGYCAIVNGQVSIGMSEDDEVKNYCKSQGGAFFRQYPLVIKGEVYPNENVKGKAKRRALAKEEGFVYIITSENPESLYDFSMAISDLGVSDAIYLPGGDAFFAAYCKDYSINETKPSEGEVFLLFKQKQ